MRIPFSVSASAAIVFVLCVSMPAHQSWGWIDTGHKIIALIAWQDLTPKTKAAVIANLKQHPRFEKDLQAGAIDGAGDDDAARRIFVNAAIWPDKIRLLDYPMHAMYHHSNWHYIDIPFVVGVPTTQPATTKPAAGAGPRNVVQALTQCVSELKKSKAPDAKSAIDLCWVEHLVGDIHQPLHAASLFSPQFPRGDYGGINEILLRDPPHADSQTDLHLIWDSLPGDFQSEELIRYEAEGLRADPKHSRQQLKDLLAVTDFMAWANESHALAVRYAYLDGQLHAADSHGSHTALKDPIPGVPPGYIENAEKVATHQVILASYRLADLLNSIYDPATPAGK